jgi:hypothetical protein
VQPTGRDIGRVGSRQWLPEDAGRAVPRVCIGTAADAQADATGAFRARAYSLSDPDSLALRVAVVQAGAADAVRLTTGVVPFRYQRHVRAAQRHAHPVPCRGVDLPR